MEKRNKVTDDLGAETAEKGNVIIVKANRALTKSEHDLLMTRMERHEERTGMKVIVIPHSVDQADPSAIGRIQELEIQMKELQEKLEAAHEEKELLSKRLEDIQKEILEDDKAKGQGSQSDDKKNQVDQTPDDLETKKAKTQEGQDPKKKNEQVDGDK